MKYFLLILLPILFIQCKSKIKMPTQPLKVHAFRLKPGQDLRKEIESFVAKEK